MTRETGSKLIAGLLFLRLAPKIFRKNARIFWLNTRMFCNYLRLANFNLRRAIENTRLTIRWAREHAAIRKRWLYMKERDE